MTMPKNATMKALITRYVKTRKTGATVQEIYNHLNKHFVSADNEAVRYPSVRGRVYELAKANQLLVLSRRGKARAFVLNVLS